MRNLFVSLLLMIVVGALDHASAQQSNGPNISVMFPERRASCAQILELERLRIDPQNGNVSVYPDDQQLYLDYLAVVSWMQGFVAGRHVSNPYHGPQIAIWLFSYCRANPNSNLFAAAAELSAALNQH